MGTSFIPLCAIIAVLIIAFLFASLPQVSLKTRYRVLYAIAIIMLFAIIPICGYMVGDSKNSISCYLLVLIFAVAVGYFCIYIAALLRFNGLKQKNQALENVLTEKQQEKLATLLEQQNEKQQDLIHKTAIVQNGECYQADLMNFIYSVLGNTGKKRAETIDFILKVFPSYFPVGASALSKILP